MGCSIFPEMSITHYGASKSISLGLYFIQVIQKRDIYMSKKVLLTMNWTVTLLRWKLMAVLANNDLVQVAWINLLLSVTTQRRNTCTLKTDMGLFQFEFKIVYSLLLFQGLSQVYDEIYCRVWKVNNDLPKVAIQFHGCWQIPKLATPWK